MISNIEDSRGGLGGKKIMLISREREVFQEENDENTVFDAKKVYFLTLNIFIIKFEIFLITFHSSLKNIFKLNLFGIIME